MPNSYNRGSSYTVPFTKQKYIVATIIQMYFEPSDCCVCNPVCSRGMYSQYVHNFGYVCFLDEPHEHQYIRQFEFHH